MNKDPLNKPPSPLSITFFNSKDTCTRKGPISIATLLMTLCVNGITELRYCWLPTGEFNKCPPWLSALLPLIAHPFSQNFKQVHGCLFKKYGMWISLFENKNFKVLTPFPLQRKGDAGTNKAIPHKWLLKSPSHLGLCSPFLGANADINLLEWPNDSCFL